MQQMLVEGPFISKELKWTQRLASLYASATKWYMRYWETQDVIMSCGEFTNVPLLGINGCISYNLVLSLRQLGYPMNDPPDAKSLEPFVLYDIEAISHGVKKVKKD